jgi:S-adenosylmethionine:tRNA ribosyltransferase-isomerase
VQYSYLRDALELWHVQTAYAGRPWAVEMPSAGWAVTAGLLRELQRRGIGVATLTHAAGLSATGDPTLDAALPLPERYEIPPATVDAVERARDAGGRVVAIGTTVVRALEGAAAAHRGQLRAGAGETDLHVTAAFTPRIVNGVLTGIHMPGTSHFDLMRAFAREDVLAAATDHAEAAGYLQHEFGDTALVLAA